MTETPDQRLQRVRTNPTEYEDRCVALVDVLGWSDLLRRSISDADARAAASVGAELVSMIKDWAQESHDLIQRAFPDLSMDVRVTHFSDTFVISTPPDYLAETTALTMVTSICGRLLDEGHYTRGGIVRGLIAHSPGAVFGPALVEAHEVERDVAKYPRIIIAPSARSLFHELGVRRDFDGLEFLDVLGAGMTEERRTKLRGLAEERLARDEGRLDRQAKHNWFLRYLSEAAVPMDDAARSKP